MQDQTDLHRLAVDVGIPAEEIPPAIAEAHKALRQYCGHSFEAATDLLKRGDVELAGQINLAVTSAVHTGPSGVRRSVSVVLSDFERSAGFAPLSTATDPPSAAPSTDDASGTPPATDPPADKPIVETTE